MLTVILGSDGGQVNGTVQRGDASTGSNIVVTVVPADHLAKHADLFKLEMAGPNGQFHADGLAPGNYSVYAWEEGEPVIFDSAELRRQFSDRAVSVTVNAGASTTVQLKAIPGEEIRKARAKQ